MLCVCPGYCARTHRATARWRNDTTPIAPIAPIERRPSADRAPIGGRRSGADRADRALCPIAAISRPIAAISRSIAVVSRSIAAVSRSCRCGLALYRCDFTPYRACPV